MAKIRVWDGSVIECEHEKALERAREALAPWMKAGDGVSFYRRADGHMGAVVTTFGEDTDAHCVIEGVDRV